MAVDSQTHAVCDSQAARLLGKRVAVSTVGEPTEALDAVARGAAAVAVVCIALEIYDKLATCPSLRVVAELEPSLWVVAKTAGSGLPAKAAKTALTVSVSSSSSAVLVIEHLQAVLTALKTHEIEVTKFEARSVTATGKDSNRASATVCYVDILGHERDTLVAQATAALQASGSDVRILGSFQSGGDDLHAVLTSLEGKNVATSDPESDTAESDSSSTSELSAKETSIEELFPLNPKVATVKLGKNMILFGLAKQLEAQGHKIHTLSFGEPDFLPPDRVIQAGIRALEQGKVRYTDMRGDPKLRELIAKYLRVAKNVEYNADTEIMISSGGQQGLFYIFYSTICPGDKVILPTPYWAVHAAAVEQMGGNLLLLHGSIDDEYLVSARALEDMLAANPDTKMFVLCNPSNPVGTLHSLVRLEALAAVLRKPQFQHVIVLADEIYEQLIYQDDGIPQRTHVSFATLPGMRDRTITINGFSKAYAMTGMRVGFVAAPSHFVSRCVLCQSIFASTVNSIGQMAAIEAMAMELEYIEQGRSRIQEVLGGLDTKRKFVVKRLREIPHVRFAYPTSAFYIFVDLSAFFRGKFGHVVSAASEGTMTKVRDVADLCEYLLRQHSVAVTPGIDFGDEYGLRISYAGAQESIIHAMDSIEVCLTKSLRFVDA